MGGEWAASLWGRCTERHAHLRMWAIWLWVKTNGIHLGLGTPPILVYFSVDWDVHWGYDLDFDPWPYLLLTLRASFLGFESMPGKEPFHAPACFKKQCPLLCTATDGSLLESPSSRV